MDNQNSLKKNKKDKILRKLFSGFSLIGDDTEESKDINNINSDKKNSIKI